MNPSSTPLLAEQCPRVVVEPRAVLAERRRDARRLEPQADAAQHAGGGDVVGTPSGVSGRRTRRWVRRGQVRPTGRGGALAPTGLVDTTGHVGRRVVRGAREAERGEVEVRGRAVGGPDDTQRLTGVVAVETD